MSLKEKLNPRNWSRGVLILVHQIISTLVISVAFLAISLAVFRTFTINDRIESARGLNGLVINEIDHDRIDEYIEKGYDAPGYSEIEKQLYRLRDAHPGVEYLYVFRVVDEGFQIVFDLPTRKYPAAVPGQIIHSDQGYIGHMEELRAGEPVEPIITMDEFGYLLTVYTAIYNSRGNVVAYAAVDYSMNQLHDYLWAITSRLMIFFAAVLLLAIILIVIFTQRRIIRPLEEMEDTAYTDALTGMKNRAAYNEWTSSTERSMRGQLTFPSWCSTSTN